MENKRKVLFVCLGNICRSPAGEGIFKKLVEERGLSDKYFIDSAGTSGWHIGDLPDKRMRNHGKKRGYEFDSRARQITMGDIDKFDYILAMDDHNYYYSMSLATDMESKNKVYRMADFLQKIKGDHIPDPYYSGAEGFELVLDMLEDACTNLLNTLERNDD